MGSWAERMVDELTVEQKVGQVILSGVGDRRPMVERLLRDGKVGALIFYGKDMPDPTSAAQLANHLQSLAELPILITADFEAGTGRIMRGGTELPSNMAIGATRSTELARQCGAVTAREARAVGVHVAFAPVVDVNVNPNNPIINIRSFGGDPQLVGELAIAWIDGCQANNCAACAKHFPGHGDTDVDSHRAMPVITHDMERMWAVELKPFQEAINAGVRSVMTAHIHFPALDPTPGIPATMSQRILTDLLRNEMNFNGVLFTDAMAMWAIKHNFDMAEAAVMALRAGADVLLADDPAITYDALLHAIRTGDISLQRLDEAVLRVLELKEWLGLHEQRYVDVNAVSAVVGADEHREVAVNVARAGITMLRNENDIVPLGADARIFAIAPPSHRYTGESPTRTLLSLLRNAFVRAETTEISENPTDDEISQVRNRARALQPDAIVFATFARAEAYREESSQIATEMVELVRELSKLAPVIALSCGSPYALMRFDDAGVWLCAYSDCDASIQAVVEVLAGRLAPTGAVPVQL